MPGISIDQDSSRKYKKEIMENMKPTEAMNPEGE
jgi:hypothetical protein